MINPLRRSSDFRSLFLTLLTFFLIIYSLKLDFKDLNIFQYIILMICLIFGIFTCTLINHNHRHHPIFKKNHYNEAFNLILSLCMGAPSTRLHLVHHFNHHLHYPSHGDWSHFELNGKGRGIKKILTYLYSATRTMTKNRSSLVNSNKRRLALRNERLILYFLGTIALIINWKISVFVIFPGWIIGLSLLLTSNLLNHDQCDTSSTINHSRDFLNRFENWFFCNNGYHTAHHLKPSLHWEELPRLHQEAVAGKKATQFTVDSFFSYLIQYCLKKS